MFACSASHKRVGRHSPHCDGLCWWLLRALETGQPTDRPFSRSFIADHLRLPNQSKQVPLLYSILTQLEGGGAAADSAGDGTQVRVVGWWQADANQW